LKAYDLAWAEGDADAACELLVDSGRRAVETEMSNRTVGGLPLNCPERMEEVLQLLGPEAAAQLERLAKEVPSDEVDEHGDIADVIVTPAVFMELKKVGNGWYIKGSTIQEIEPTVTQEEVEQYEEEVAQDGESPEEHAQEQEEEGKLKTESAAMRKEAQEAATEGVETHSGEGVVFVECPEEPYTPNLIVICDASTETATHYQVEFEVLENGRVSVPLRIYLSHEH
jgi:hypothetical protein